ncbi:MAG: hypothetical protein EXR75_01150 [Myxococcales bacterium]|nr:hypothetical protein [Myxococcales bacterium]
MRQSSRGDDAAFVRGTSRHQDVDVHGAAVEAASAHRETADDDVLRAEFIQVAAELDEVFDRWLAGLELASGAASGDVRVSIIHSQCSASSWLRNRYTPLGTNGVGKARRHSRACCLLSCRDAKPADTPRLPTTLAGFTDGSTMPERRRPRSPHRTVR